MFLVLSVGVCAFVPPWRLSKRSVHLKQSRFSVTVFQALQEKIVLPGQSSLSSSGSQVIFLTLLFPICPSFVCLTLFPTSLRSHHLPTYCPVLLFLLSWWASQEAVHVFEECNLLCLPFPFPFQSLIHSWNEGALHADEQKLTFSRAYVQKRDGLENGSGVRWGRWERGAREAEGKKFVWWSRQQLLTGRFIHFSFISIQPNTSAQQKMKYLCRSDDTFRTKWQKNFRPKCRSWRNHNKK